MENISFYDYLHGTQEFYTEGDFLAGIDVMVGDLVMPKNIRTSYYQREFDVKSMCTIYACYGAYTSYTGKVISEEDRKEFVNICIREGIVKVGVGGMLHTVVDRFVKRINIKHNTSIIYIRVALGDSKKYQDKGWGIITGYYGNAKFVKDKNDNCVIDNFEVGPRSYGHAIVEYDWGWTNDSFPTCQLYFNKQYEKFIDSKNHFISGYILAMTEDEITKEQIKKDKETLEFMSKYVKLVDLDKPITRRDCFLTVGRIAQEDVEKKDLTIEDYTNQLLDKLQGPEHF